MTVDTEINKVIVPGNGVATVFSFSPVVIFKSSDLVVVTTVIATGVETVRAEGIGATNWSIDITTFPATGSITFPADEITPLPSTEKITIKRVLPLTQLTDLQNQGGYFADTQETAFDKGVLISQQQQEEIDRSFTFPLSYEGAVVAEIPAPTTGDEGKVLGLNPSLTGFIYLVPSSSTFLTLPTSSTDNALPRFDGTSGQALQDGTTTVDDSGNMIVNGSSHTIKHATSPRLAYEAVTANLDMGKFRDVAADGSLSYQYINDAGTAAFSYLNAHRHPSFRTSPDSNIEREFGRHLNNTGAQNTKVTEVISDRVTVAQKASQTGAPFGVTFASSHNQPGDLPEEKAPDANFDSSGEWFATTSWTFSGNKATKASGDTNPLSTVLIDPIQPGVDYLLGWQVTGRTAGSVTVSLAGVTGTTKSTNIASLDTIKLPLNFASNAYFDLAGDFGNGWSGTGWAFAGTEAVVASSGAAALTTTSNATILASTKYRVWFYCSVTAGTITPSVGGSSDGTAVSATQPGWFFQDVTSSGSPTQTILFTPDGSFTGAIDAVRVIPIALTFTPTSDFDGAVSANLNAQGYMIREKIPTSSDHSSGIIHRSFDGATILYGRANAPRQFLITGNDGDQMALFGGNANEDNFGIGDFSKGTIPYGSLSGSFVVDDWLYGSTSGAAGQIVSDTGTVVTLKKIFGTFQNAEIIRGRKGGQATTSAIANLHVDELASAEHVVLKDDDGATEGPVVDLTRISVSPAASDLLGAHNYRGRDSAGNTDIYAKTHAKIITPTSGAEDGTYTISTMQAGTLNDVVTVDEKGGFRAGGLTSSVVSSTEKFSMLGVMGQKFEGNGIGGFYWSDDVTSSTSMSYRQNGSGNVVGAISHTTTATTYATTSDYRVKDKALPIANVKARFMQIAAYNGEFKQEPGKKFDYFIAHELEQIVPGAVVGEKDAVDQKGNAVLQGVDASKLVPLMVAMIQDLVKENKDIKERLDDAEDRLSNIDGL